MSKNIIITAVVAVAILAILVSYPKFLPQNKTNQTVSIEDFSQIVKERIQECEKLSDEIIGVPLSVNSEKDKCLTELAIEEKNMKICYLIDDAIFRDDIGKKDSRINYCFGNYAGRLDDVKGCDAMVGDYSSQCYSSLNKIKF